MKFGDPRLPGRFWAKVRVDESGCWIWTAGRHAFGYGVLRVEGRNEYAHRLTLEISGGPIRAGLDVDHLCRIPACCNPDHLEAVTHRENILRGAGVAARAATATHCPRGHAYDDENTYRSPSGDRRCRECHRQESRDRYRRARRAA